MSYNLPDGVSDADIDRAMGDDPTNEEQEWLDEVADAQNTCTAFVTQTVDLLIKKRKKVSEDTLAGLLEVLAEELAHEIDSAVSNLSEAGYHDLSAYPDDHKQLIAQEHERLIDSFRPKRPDVMGLILDSLRPVPTTLLATGRLGDEQ